MTFDVRTANQRAINSMTKYPPIPTYHTLDPKNGRLNEPAITFTGPVIATEKIDGTNARIIWLPDGSYLIGSREELLYAQGDLIPNPTLGIVDALRRTADQQAIHLDHPGQMVVHYLEVYGGKTTPGSRNYTHRQQVGARLFDVAVIRDHDTILGWEPERISRWRDHNGQTFMTEEVLLDIAAACGYDVTPRVFTADAATLPTGIHETMAMLSSNLPHTGAALDGIPGRAEGLVLRTLDRSVIAKARFQDYERTLRHYPAESRQP